MRNIGSSHNKNPSISVIESILNSRIDQMIAITLPSDRHRLDILETIKTTYSISQRLSSFCDYMIDYIETLSSKLDRTKNELQEHKHHSTKTTKNIKHHSKHCSKKHRQEKHDNFLQDANYDIKGIDFNIDSDTDDDLDNIPNTECIKKLTQSINDNNQPQTKNDYLSTLKLLNAQEGQLSKTVNDLLNQNMRLQRLHNQDRAILLKQHAVIHGLDDQVEDKNNYPLNCDDFNNESSSDSDCPLKNKMKKKRYYSDSCSDNEDGILEECKQLKSDFQQISNEIQNLNTQVQRRYHSCRKRCRNC